MQIGLANGKVHAGWLSGANFELTKFASRRFRPVFYSNLCLVIAIILTLAGVWIQWHVGEYSMSGEEAVKNRKLTAEQVVRRLVLIRRSGQVLTFSGMGLLLVSLLMTMG